MKTRYRSKLNGEFFKTEEEVIEHLEGEGIEDAFEAYYDVITLSEEDVKALEARFKKICEDNPDDPNCKEYYGEIDDTPQEDEILDESSAITEEEMEARKIATIVGDQYLNGELSTTEETMFLSRLLGMTQDKSTDKKTHDKVFEPISTTKTAIPRTYQNVVDRLSDERCITCPLCHKEWKEIAQDLSLEAKDPKVREKHLSSVHINLWKALKDLFGMGSDEIPDDRVSTVPNPESCSELETLSKEELAERINSDETLRHLFFREWLKKLKNKE